GLVFRSFPEALPSLLIEVGLMKIRAGHAVVRVLVRLPRTVCKSEVGGDVVLRKGEHEEKGDADEQCETQDAKDQRLPPAVARLSPAGQEGVWAQERNQSQGD